ncbi:hypothetical protein ASG17_12455 [Brevundimonas sp. Leaf363]|uniref:DUF885 domain-containing protein n=1 Tax=Brevundimonas sp. Leaf363 TaxID=1736353 RepID=UPI0006F51A81|nr:DUF885 family protein [Brevundimonas sp. Leaf363]KQS54433.1 hypothetical protein ASG17_12455 [Brevundimonas sp. Leaf363]
MRRMILATASAVLMAAAAIPSLAGAQTTPATATAPSEEDAALDAVIRDVETYQRALDPISAGFEGDKAALSRLPDASREFELAQRAPTQAFIDRLEAIDAAKLSAEGKINHSFLLWTLRRSIQGLDLDTGRLAFDSEGGPGTWVQYLGTGTRITSMADAEAWMSRIAGFATIYEQTMANARRGLATGMVQPKSVVESALVLARNDVAVTPENDAMLAPFKTLPASMSADQQAVLRTRAADLVARRITPMRRQWLSFLQDEYLPKAPEAPGLAHRPGGREMYAYLMAGYTTTDLTPDQVHQIGVEEVARIRARMDGEMHAAGWTGDFAGFLNFLRTDPQFYSQTREDLLEKASEMAKRADDGLPALFATLPRLPYGVRPVPRDIEETYTTGRYNGGSMQNGIAGGYMVNTSHLDQRPLYELPALTLHEAVPGHHIQIALQQEAADQPYFRRNANVTAYTEGWGLYAEYLGEEMGFYRTPYERFGRLSYEMWRACRLVADTGLHWLGWSTEQARACFRDNSALAPHNIETELQRYIGWPGQATGYKIGEIRLRAIRARAEAALGDRFNVRTFHDAILVDGPLPLDLLDQRMDAWIAEQVAKPAE